MKHHLAQNAPYHDTSISYARTQAEIGEMLKEAGAVAMRWTETPESMKGTAMPRLEFVMEFEKNGEKKHVGVRIDMPITTILTRRARGGRLIQKARTNPNGSMRLLYWYLQARLNASRFGLEDITESFLSKTIMNLPGGQTTTVGKALLEHPEVFAQMLPSFEILTPALEHRDAIDIKGEKVE